MHKLIQIEDEYRKKAEEIPDFSPGDTVRVKIRVREGNKERLQSFEGVVLQRRVG